MPTTSKEHGNARCAYTGLTLNKGGQCDEQHIDKLVRCVCNTFLMFQHQYIKKLIIILTVLKRTMTIFKRPFTSPVCG